MFIEKIKRFLTFASRPVVAAGLAVLMCTPTLFTGLSTDDLIHTAMLDPQSPIKAKGFYSNADRFVPAVMTLFDWSNGELTGMIRDYGILPWWTPPDLKMSFWRPLSAATHWLDAQFWASNSIAMHLHSALWYGILIFAVGYAYRGMVKPPWAAGFALLAFAINQEGYETVAWIAARNSILAAMFVALTVRLYHDRVQSGSFDYGCAALAAFAAGLLAGEAAVAALAYLVSYAITMDERPWRARLLSLIPFFLVLIAWRIAYQTLGFGVSQSGFYIDPGKDPVRYALNMAEWTPIILLDVATLPVLTPYASLAPAVKLWAWLAGLMALAALGFAFLPLLRADRRARFWALGLLPVLVPACATTVPSDRVTLGLMFGFAPLAALFVTGVATDAAWLPRAGIARRSLQGVALLLVFCHVLMPLQNHVVRLARMIAHPGPAVPFVETVFHAPSQELIVVTSPYAIHLPYIPFRNAEEGVDLPAHIRNLSSSLSDVIVTRTASNALTITSTGSPLIPARPVSADCPPSAPLFHPLYHGWLVSTLFRSDTLPFKPGSTTVFPGLKATVDLVDERGLPTQTTFTFDRQLEDPHFKWTFWNTPRGVYELFVPPAQGQRTGLPGPFHHNRSTKGFLFSND